MNFWPVNIYPLVAVLVFVFSERLCSARLKENIPCHHQSLSPNCVAASKPQRLLRGLWYGGLSVETGRGENGKSGKLGVLLLSYQGPRSY